MSVPGSLYGPPQKLFHRQGLWTPDAAFVTAAEVNNGDTFIVVNDLPNVAATLVTNLYLPDLLSDPKLDPVGMGKYLRLDPTDEDVQIQIRSHYPFVESGSNIIIHLEVPVTGLSGALASGAEIGMGHSPVLNIGSMGREMTLIGLSHPFDDRDEERSTGPSINLALHVAEHQNGPFWVDSAGITIPTFAPHPGGDPNAVDTYDAITVTFPRVPFAKLVPSRGGGDDGSTVFSIHRLW